MADGSNEGRGSRLGRLFAALVNTEGDGADAPDLASALEGGGVPGREAAAAPDNTSVLDVDELGRSLAASPDPLALLAGLVVDVRSRAERAGLAEEGPTLPPSALEVHLAERLVEAGLLEPDVELPSLHVVRPRTSDLFYLRVEDAQLPYLAKVRVLRIEAALNAALLATRVLPDANAASGAELVRCEQRVARSVTSQAPELAARLEPPVAGEWDVRYALAFGIEALRLPYRLTARFRVNARHGRAAIEVDLVPPRAWAATAYVDGLGVVPATAEMRRRAASEYNLRLGVLLAGYALLAAPELSEVWVAGVVDTARGHACYYSVRVERGMLEGVDLAGALDPFALMASWGAELDARDRTLEPVRQTFRLDDARFCPPFRYDPPELSGRGVPPSLAAALGCAHVRDLGIDEAARRRRVARELSRHLTSSTEQNVHAILSAARAEDAEDVERAARRCVTGLIEGTLADDPESVTDAFVSSELDLACSRAREALAAHDPARAAREVEDALLPVDGLGLYDDADATIWRSFGSYADRALFNRLLARPGVTCGLAPAAYFEAHLIGAAAAGAQGRIDEALAHARRACEVAPLSAQASLALAQCLEASGDAAAAERELCRLLSLAHDPESLGLGYLAMAQLQWQGDHVLAAQACYQRATRHLGAPALVAGLAVVALIGHVGATAGGALSAERADAVLEAAGVPLAPTEEVGGALLEATRAAVDAEVFPVARGLLRALCALSRDDVYFGVLRSIEDEPDR
ncbi:hypothetical protein [Olsenella sp. An290]|uniref:hypothetical protein n=1 Tax=Olsenella sp. An290 TaxID=1965625 RepID=UPI000B384118|nr:hypothetical protein [Olsenella sp. An290]OUO34582.1 hypothetical protein B5F84_06195 [Olsenella sp. An290]